MPSPPAGWYDDPARSGRLRYWDGAAWTEQLMDRPGAPVTTPQGPDAATTPQGPDAATTPQGPDAATTPQGPGPVVTAPGPAPAPVTTPPGPDAPTTPPGLGLGPVPRPQGAAGRSLPGRRAADGTLLAPWWRRLLAWAIDAGVTLAMGLPVTMGLLATRWDQLASWSQATQAASARGSELPMPPPELVSAVAAAWTAATLVYFLYELIALTKFGTTWGRRLLSIRVRVPGEPEQARTLPMQAASRRSGLKVVGQIAGGTPVLGDVGLLVTLVDLGRGMLDRDRRTLHDLAGGTEVVMHEPHRR